MHLLPKVYLRSFYLQSSIFKALLLSESTVLSLGVQDDQERRVAKRLRRRAVERLWNLTEELNVLYRDNWTALADREMMR